MKKALIHISLLAGLIWLAAPAHAAPAGFPSRAVISMKGYWGILPVGTAVQTWTLAGSRYRLENRMSGLGFRLRYLSEGLIDGDVLKPLYYAEFRGRDARPRYESRFDWTQQTISLGRTGEQRLEPMQLPVQDLNALPFDLAWRNGVPQTYAQLTNGRKLRQGAFVRAADQTVDVGGQQVKTVHLVSRLPNEQTVELWLAPAFNYLPVRVRYDGSEKIEMHAFKVEMDGKVVAGE